MISVRYLFLTVMLMAGSAGHAVAVQESAIKSDIAVVERQALLQGSTEWKEFMEKIQAKAKKLEADIMKKQTNLEAEYKKMLSAEGKTALTKTEEEKLQKMGMALEAARQQAQTDIQEEAAEMQKLFEEELKVAVAEVVKAKGLKFVFFSEVALYYPDSSDITDDVVSVLNKRYASKKRAEKVKKSAE